MCPFPGPERLRAHRSVSQPGSWAESIMRRYSSATRTGVVAGPPPRARATQVASAAAAAATKLRHLRRTVSSFAPCCCILQESSSSEARKKEAIPSMSHGTEGLGTGNSAEMAMAEGARGPALSRWRSTVAMLQCGVNADSSAARRCRVACQAARGAPGAGALFCVRSSGGLAKAARTHGAA